MRFPIHVISATRLLLVGSVAAKSILINSDQIGFRSGNPICSPHIFSRENNFAVQCSEIALSASFACYISILKKEK